MNRALLVGINAYPDHPLRGCVNDVRRMAAYLVRDAGFAGPEIRLLLDRRASRAAILARLRWLVADARPGDRLLFQFSGHGVQVSGRGAQGERDGLDEAICPVDFDWSASSDIALRDDDFAALFATIPPGVSFTWISDSCHSGDLSRDAALAGVTPRRMLPPDDLVRRLHTARAAASGSRTRRLGEAAPHRANIALLAACQDDETAADAPAADGYGGAFTSALLAALDDPAQRAAPLPALMTAVRDAVASRFRQHPRLEGNGTARRGAFLATTGRNQSAKRTKEQTMIKHEDTLVTFNHAVHNLASNDAAFRDRFQRAALASARVSLRESGHPSPGDDALVGAAQPVQSRGGITVWSGWWGFQLYIPSSDLQSFTTDAAIISAAIAAAGAAISPWVTMIAGFIAAGLTALKALDHGRGIYISMSWFAPGVFVPTSA